jgi:hypothetical protein
MSPTPTGRRHTMAAASPACSKQSDSFFNTTHLSCWNAIKAPTYQSDSFLREDRQLCRYVIEDATPATATTPVDNLAVGHLQP